MFPDAAQILESSFANVDIFLREPEWQSALQSTIIPTTDFTDRSEPVVTLWMTLACAPGLFKRVTEAVISQRLQEKEAIVGGLRNLLVNLSKWSVRWESSLIGAADLEVDGPCSELVSSREQCLTRYLAYLAFTNRFLVAIHPPAAAVAEKIAIVAATRIIQLTETQAADPISKLSTRVAFKIACSIQATAEQWSRATIMARSRSLKASGTVDPDMFSSWCALIGRTI